MPEQKELLLLHPLTERLANNKIRHVPRHIELTAVFKRDLKNKYKESKRIERFKKPLEFESNNNSLIY